MSLLYGLWPPLVVSLPSATKTATTGFAVRNSRVGGAFPFLPSLSRAVSPLMTIVVATSSLRDTAGFLLHQRKSSRGTKQVIMVRMKAFVD